MADQHESVIQHGNRGVVGVLSAMPAFAGDARIEKIFDAAYIAYIGDFPTIQRILEEGIDIDALNPVLLQAAARGRYRIVKFTAR
jgi:hypothetical protein